MQDEELEHHRTIKWWPSHFAHYGWLIECYLKNRTKDIPVDMLFKYQQWIFELGQVLQEKKLVEKAQWIDVLHGNAVD